MAFLFECCRQWHMRMESPGTRQDREEHTHGPSPDTSVIRAGGETKRSKRRGDKRSAIRRLSAEAPDRRITPGLRRGHPPYGRAWFYCAAAAKGCRATAGRL